MPDTSKELLERLAATPSDTYPLEVLTEIRTRLPEMTPVLLEVLKNALTHPVSFDYHAEDSVWLLPTFSAYFLAEAREKAAYPLLVKLLNLPPDDAETIFGELITEDMKNILASVFDGQTELLLGLIVDSEACEFARSCGLGTLMCLLHHEVLSQDAVAGIFTELMRGGLTDDNQVVWSNLASYSGDLGLAHLIPDIQAAYAGERCDSMFDHEKNVVERAGRGGDPRWKKMTGGLITDTISLTKDWACFSPPAPAPKELRSANIKIPQFFAPPVSTTVKSAPKIGRNDPCPCVSGKKYKKCCGA